jgi:hypothetical protein
VLVPGDTSLRPLKPQLDIHEPAPSPVVPALFVAAFAGLTAFGYVLHRRAAALRPAYRGVIDALPPPSAEALARQQLQQLVDDGLAERDVAEYYTRIASVVRGYLSARFAFPAYAMTRRELEREMRRSGIDRWPARVTANLLEQCDAVEFAQFRPAPARRAADLTAAYEILDLTSTGDARRG